VPVIANVSAQAVNAPDDIRDLLQKQVTAMVRWRECVLAMRADGAEQLVEIGAGKILKTLTRRIDREMEAFAVGGIDEIEKFVQAL
jgi:[acyl-carrier-protein] S-malonyltransferase